MATIRLEKQHVIDFSKHFLFGVPMQTPDGSDLLVMTKYEGCPANDDTVIVENKHIFEAREELLSVSKKYNKLVEFSKWWEKHLETLKGG